MYKLISYIITLVSKLERLYFLKNSSNQSNSPLLKNGFVLHYNENINLNKLKIKEEFKLSNYSSKLIIEEESLKAFVKSILKDSQIQNELLGFFNSPFSIDFITYYRTYSLPEKLQNKSFYANHWHTDTLLTENSVKILCLPSSINSAKGPFQALSLKETLCLTSNGFMRGENLPNIQLQENPSLVFDGKESKVLFVRPNLCMHKAGIPNANEHRDQLMIQLNPAKNWSYREDLFNMQYQREPTLAFIKNTLRKKITLT
ncbi:hypothetical protein BMS_0341 [Halobacteriovorax marinus SJ]|uniref:Phytanoyl-CoA dioxygenase n=1 Tax=Halobacteriovorax marinus (strain ATCC BAA-682 / DSM 15412 / SJ) TaxID=862908 RepID=E1X3G9_HALMS|nr:hypothetical protein [Halobacteriovorax marinus]CBW25264.1 hypothetical protein BMS_0341 [Halobacteriovorax marinus SJ]